MRWTGLADALEVVRDRSPVTVDTMVQFFTAGRVNGTEDDQE